MTSAKDSKQQHFQPNDQYGDGKTQWAIGNEKRRAGSRKENPQSRTRKSEEETT
jgi:hypothetical protein